MLNNQDPEAAWSTFTQVLGDTLDKHVPLRTVRSSRRAPWMRPSLLREVRRKRKLWRRFTVTQDPLVLDAYRKQVKKVKKDTKKAKKEFEKRLAQNSKSNPKAFYSYLNSKKCNRVSIGPLKVNGKKIEDDKEMAEVLNNFFGSVFTEEDLSEIPTQEKLKPDLPSLDDFLFSENDVKNKLKKLKKQSAPGPDGITPNVLIELSDVLCVPLAMIFNMSFVTGIVPSEWRMANVTPIFKKGKKINPGNYRPVSLTCIASRVMESILKDHIVDYLTFNDLILKSQHGFMKKRSCLTNLLEYIENLTDLVDRGHAVDVVYLDFSKAFDKVPHERLAVMLQAHGISGKILDWIKSWLRGRKQRVVLNGSVSTWIQVFSGVPQGSVLGPLLFIIFINLFDQEVGVLDIISKYADDTKVGGVVDEPEQIETLQNVLNRIMQWADTWQMVFNKDKCHVMHLGRKNTKHFYTMGGYAPGGQVLDKSTWEEDLGVIVSDDLKPSKQCLVASKKANSVLGRMARSFSYRSKDVWLRLYRIYIRPILKYDVQAWSLWLART